MDDNDELYQVYRVNSCNFYIPLLRNRRKIAISRYLAYGCVWSSFLCFFQFTYIWYCSFGGEYRKIPPYIEHLQHPSGLSWHRLGESSWLRHEAMHRFLRLQKAITSHMWLFTEAHRGVMSLLKQYQVPTWLNKNIGSFIARDKLVRENICLFFCITAVILTEKHQGVSCDDWS